MANDEMSNYSKKIHAIMEYCNRDSDVKKEYEEAEILNNDFVFYPDVFDVILLGKAIFDAALDIVKNECPEYEIIELASYCLDYKKLGKLYLNTIDEEYYMFTSYGFILYIENEF